MHAFEEKFANSNRTPKRELILFHTVQLRIFYNRTMPRHCKSTYSDNRVDTASALINIYFNDNRICKLQFYHTKLCIVSPCITPDIYYNIELQNRTINLFIYTTWRHRLSDSIYPPAFYPRTINSFSNFLQSFLFNRDYITPSLKFTPEEGTLHAHCVFTTLIPAITMIAYPQRHVRARRT